MAAIANKSRGELRHYATEMIDRLEKENEDVSREDTYLDLFWDDSASLMDLCADLEDRIRNL